MRVRNYLTSIGQHILACLQHNQPLRFCPVLQKVQEQFRTAFEQNLVSFAWLQTEYSVVESLVISSQLQLVSHLALLDLESQSCSGTESHSQQTPRRKNVIRNSFIFQVCHILPECKTLVAYGPGRWPNLSTSSVIEDYQVAKLNEIIVGESDPPESNNKFFWFFVCLLIFP